MTEDIDNLKRQVTIRSSQGLERSDPIRGYQAAKAELDRAWANVEAEFAEEVLDEKGREIPAQDFLAGLKLDKKLVGADAQMLQEEITQGLATRLGAFLDTDAPPMNMTGVGIVGVGLSLPIVPIPTVAFSPEGMTERQVAELQEMQREITRAGSVLLQLNFQPGSIRGGIVPSQLPEGLMMEDNPDTKIQIAFTPGFKSGRRFAGAVFNTVLETPTLKSIRLPQGQLPPG